MQSFENEAMERHFFKGVFRGKDGFSPENDDELPLESRFLCLFSYESVVANPF